MACFITAPEAEPSAENQWIAYRADVKVSGRVPEEAPCTIACDSKYWLWINGELAVFEGGLKRGPKPDAAYYDVVDIAPYLHRGRNKVAVLQWYFGKTGFSHVSSGAPALYFSSETESVDLFSSTDWKAAVYEAYGTRDGAKPNWRLPESNICFDQRLAMKNWQTAPLKSFGKAAKEWDAEDLNDILGELRERPIPMWKDHGIKSLKWTVRKGEEVDTLVANFPYDLQMTPIIKVRDRRGGNTITIETNHSRMEWAENISAQYITAKGCYTYESLGWMNGEQLYLFVPHGVKVLKLSYRETGYDAEATGKFSCNDPFFERFWAKAQRTMYVNMRDTFYDCPDRERSQWWGDIVVLMGQSFYMYSSEVQKLLWKGIHELCEWQKPDGVLHSPIPGNYGKELPCQMLAAVGKYGFWTYYMNTGDKQTIEFAYPYVKKYLDLWHLDSRSLAIFRPGGWNWGDWGTDVDKCMLQSCWLSLAYEGAANMAQVLGLGDEAAGYMELKARLNKGIASCWNGSAYRHPDYTDDTDDRAQAMAVLCGAAPEQNYAAITATLHEKQYASPYMEKYVMEALFAMGEGEYAMQRIRSKYDEMISDPFFSTLWEGWHKVGEGFGTNHAWGGGALTVITSKLMGIEPVEPGWTKVRIAPKPAWFTNCSLCFDTPAGHLDCVLAKDGDKWQVTATAAEGIELEIIQPE